MVCVQTRFTPQVLVISADAPKCDQMAHAPLMAVWRININSQYATTRDKLRNSDSSFDSGDFSRYLFLHLLPRPILPPSPPLPSPVPHSFASLALPLSLPSPDTP